ncbi:MAG: CDP-diacylglycerol--serine O-phosphatidyltransferase [Verrucomicrobia bacterium]|nr:CDP-diacylglycerol--serine O-phosphatidyltransferase [Verrucomicrobiota bacterium]
MNGDETGVGKVYVLPNLFTAGNLLCGFFALTWIFQYEIRDHDLKMVERALWLILGAFACDFLDGRVARFGGKESAFGREFDSLADLVSFGVAPAFLVYRIVLQEFPRTGWMVAAVYLACGALRLARFNILAMRGASSKEFVGLPIPAAAAMVVSVTLFMMWLQKQGIITPVGTPEHPLGPWRYGLPALLLVLSGLMVSTVKYPTFKKLDWTLRESLAALVGTLVVGFFALQWPEVTLSALFVLYLIYGLVRPWVSKRFRREIEIGDEDEDEKA